MNPLLNAHHCTLFDLDSTFLAKARFEQPTPGFITLIFFDRQDLNLPDAFFLMPEGGEHDFVSYFCTNTHSVSDFYVETTERTYYTLEATTRDTPQQREELRVNISMPVDAAFENSPKLEPILIKNISAGGLMFISSKKLEKGMSFSFLFTVGRSPLPVNARIVAIRPTHLPDTFSYCCQFTGLLAKTETAIRNFVFTEDLMQKKRAEE